MTLRNDTNQEVSFVLDDQGPADWTVTAVPAGQTQAATAVGRRRLDRGASRSPPIARRRRGRRLSDHADRGRRPGAVRDDLGVTITGSYALTLNTQDGRLNARATAGGDTPLNLVVTNTGTAPLTNVTITATPPQGWQVTFAPETLPTIAPNTPTTVVATIHVRQRASPATT